LWVGFANTDGNGDRNGDCNSDGHSNDDSSSVAHAYSDTTDNTYTTALSNAAAAPVNKVRLLDAGTRESIREFLQGAKAERVLLAPSVEAAVSAANELAGGTSASRTDSSRGEPD